MTPHKIKAFRAVEGPKSPFLAEICETWVNSEAEAIKDKRNAQVVVLAYATGDAAGVQWPSGNVATKVSAVVVGQFPPGGVFKTTRFQATLSPAEASKTYRYISINAQGDLFVDPVGGQNPNGQ